MDKYIKASLDAFNVSKNCDRSTVGAFYTSYVDRKKKIIAGKMLAVDKGNVINHKKLAWEVGCLDYTMKYPDRVKAYISVLLSNSSVPNPYNDSVIQRARQLVGGNNEN